MAAQPGARHGPARQGRRAWVSDAGDTAWRVAFSARGVNGPTPWYLRGMHPAFAHCFAFRPFLPGYTMVLNQVGSGLQIDVAAQDAADFTRNLLAGGRRCVLLTGISSAPPMRPYLRGPMTCVEAVKSLLGIEARRVLTPRQLYRHLRARGARWDMARET